MHPLYLFLKYSWSYAGFLPSCSSGPLSVIVSLDIVIVKHTNTFTSHDALFLVEILKYKYQL